MSVCGSRLDTHVHAGQSDRRHIPIMEVTSIAWLSTLSKVLFESEALVTLSIEIQLYFQFTLPNASQFPL